MGWWLRTDMWYILIVRTSHFAFCQEEETPEAPASYTSPHASSTTASPFLTNWSEWHHMSMANAQEPKKL